jgi:hypothetical protein
MLMQKIRDNAAWVVLIAVVCFIALIMVDWGMSPGNSMSQSAVVGKAAGEKIQYEELDRYVQQQATQASQQGRALTGEDYAKLRRQIFDELVRQRIVNKVFKTYKLAGTPEEVLDFLRRNPPPGAESAPIFMGPDSQFSRPMYEKWLADPRIYADPYMRAMEAEVTLSRLPDEQLQRLLQAGIVASSLETGFRARREMTRGWGVVVVAAEDSFTVDSATTAEVKAYFEAHPDSFHTVKDVAKIPYVGIARSPSHADSVQVREFADTLIARIQAGESFDTLAKDYSEDPGSAANFGSLGGFQNKNTWVPTFGQGVAALQPGQLSAPIQTSFGWHIIRLNASKVEGADTLYDASHILLQVTPSPDAIEAIKDSLEALAAKVKAGASFGDVAKAAGLSVDTVRVAKGEIATTNAGPVTGLSAWAFRGQKDEKVSEVLDNERHLFLAGPGEIVKAGRDLQAADLRIRRSLEVSKRRLAATKWLADKAAAIQACDTASTCFQAVGKISSTTFQDRPSESYIAGYGFASPELYASWAQASTKPRTWSKPQTTGSGAAMLRLDSVAVPEAAQIEQAAKDPARRQGILSRRLQTAYAEWFTAQRKSTKVEDNLDRFYRD